MKAEKGEVTIAMVYELIQEFRNEVRDQYVTKEEFNPVKNIAFGTVGAVAFSVLGALLTLVIKTVIAK